jgi:hypothetical protein
VRLTRSIILSVSVALLVLSGCNTPNRLIKSIKKKQIKLEQKGVLIPKDTITIVKHDTIIDTYTINDTTYIIKTITNTITLEPVIEYRTRFQTRVEYKYKTKYLKAEVIKVKQETKQVKAENRGITWWLLYIGIGLGIGFMVIVKRLFG